MTNFNNPLDDIRVASPCPADWNAMYGDDRKRFCGECQMNVYNLSGMTRAEAEQLVSTAEGRLCVRFFRRADGTVLTQNCPVGWAKVKQRVSRVATAAFSVIAGLFGGIFAFSMLKEATPERTMGTMVERPQQPLMGDVAPNTPVQGKVRVDNDRVPPNQVPTVGVRVAPVKLVKIGK